MTILIVMRCEEIAVRIGLLVDGVSRKSDVIWYIQGVSGELVIF
jgi:hypothetical protein